MGLGILWWWWCGEGAGFLGSSVVKISAVQETQVGPLGQGDTLEKEVTFPSILSWEIPWTEKPGGLQSSSIQFSSVTQLCPTLCNSMNRSTPGLPVHHQLLESSQTHVHCVGDAIQPSYPLSSPSPPAPNPSQHQGLFQQVNSSHEVAKVLEFQLQHQSFQ